MSENEGIQKRIKRLPEKLRKNGFQYRLVQRDDTSAIYSQHNDLGQIISYEAFIIRMNKPHPMAEEDLKNYDVVERFPTAEDFGKKAWTYRTLEEAKKRYDSIDRS